MRFTALHWSAALAGSLALHFLATTVMREEAQTAQIERSSGDSVMVASELASNVSTVSSDDTVEATEPVTEANEVPETEQEELEPVEPETVERQDTAEPANTVSDRTETTDLKVETADTVNPDLAVPPETEEVEESSDPKPAAETDPQEVDPNRSKLLAVPVPRPKPAAKPKPKQVQPSQQRQISGSNRKAQPQRKPGDRGRNKRQTTGTANISNYMGRVASRLHRQKRYPSAARRKKIRGTVVVSFTILRNGSVAGVRLARRSGHAVLDQEVLSMVRRASPFPPIPANAGRNSITVTVPISFRSR